MADAVMSLPALSGVSALTVWRGSSSYFGLSDWIWIFCCTAYIFYVN